MENIIKLPTDKCLGQAAILLGHNLLESHTQREIEYFLEILVEFIDANRGLPEFINFVKKVTK